MPIPRTARRLVSVLPPNEAAHIFNDWRQGKQIEVRGAVAVMFILWWLP